MKLPDRDEPMGRVPIPECIKGRVYLLRSRNLTVGVYDGREGFIGIRTKFGDRFLFTEYHWDQGEPHGTVSGCQDTGIDVPDDIVIETSLGTVDGVTKKPVIWRGSPAGGGKGWCFADTGDPPEHDSITPTTVRNRPLFVFLDDLA